MSEKRERLGSIVERDVAAAGLLEQRCPHAFFFWPILREGLAGLHLHLHLPVFLQAKHRECNILIGMLLSSANPSVQTRVTIGHHRTYQKQTSSGFLVLLEGSL